MDLNVTLRQLRFLLKVAEHGSFTRAAEALYVSQPTISAAMAEVERQAGVPIFQLVGRRVQLTEAGEILCAHGARVLSELSDAARALDDLRGGETGRLVVGASTTPGTYLLPPLLGSFRNVHPNVALALEIADSRAVVGSVLAGQVDLGVVGETRFDLALDVSRLQTETLVLVTAPESPLAAKKSIQPTDLAEQPFIVREVGSSTREVLERSLRQHGIEPRVVMELGNTEAVKQSVAAGLGVSLVSEHAVAVEQRAGVLVARPVRGLHAKRGFFVVQRRTLRPTVLHERFRALLSGRAASSARP